MAKLNMLNMKRYFYFTSKEIMKHVESSQIGNYALGYVNDDDTLIVQYIGRSYSDVKDGLL